MSKTRQQILILNLSLPELDSKTVAWALYDGAKRADELQMNSGDSDTLPYDSVLAAMRDGWNVIQMPILPVFLKDHEHDTGHLPYEYTLERKVEVHG